MKTRLFPTIKFYSKLDSTNKFAKNILQQKTGENFVIIAREQTAGKGRFGRKWVSTRGGLWFTMVLVGKQYHSTITLLTSIALHKTVLQLVSPPNLSIKWPNDLICDNKKIAGILSSTSRKSTIIGIGLNVNQKQMPNEIDEIATSIFIETAKKHKLKKILKHFLHIFTEQLKRYNKNGFKSFQKYYNDFNYLAGKKIGIKLGQQKFEGDASGVSENGELLLHTSAGLKKILSAEKIDIISRS